MKRRQCPRCKGKGLLYDDKVAGKVLRAQREAIGLSLRKMAVKLGITPAYLSYLETGQAQWSDEKVRQFQRECSRTRQAAI